MKSASEIMEQFGFDQDIFDSGDEFFMEESDDDDEDYHDPGSDGSTLNNRNCAGS